MLMLSIITSKPICIILQQTSVMFKRWKFRIKTMKQHSLHGNDMTFLEALIHARRHQVVKAQAEVIVLIEFRRWARENIKVEAIAVAIAILIPRR